MVTPLEYIDPAYYNDFVYLDICSKNCMYAEAKKSVYVTLEALLILWVKFSNSLEKMVYHRNK